MSREIKFRAWDDKGKYWYPAETIRTFFDYLSEKFTVIADWFNKNAISLEQYTGLKDKNGKEIYEGDIVQIPEDWDEYGIAAGQRYEVYFAYGGFRCKPWGGCKRRGDKGYWIEDSEDFEVIGNVHENPELLQEYEELDK